MGKATLEFQVDERDGVRVIHIRGPLDSSTYDACKAYLDPIVQQARARIVLDCGDLTYVNSRGVTLLMHYQRAATLGFSFFGIAALRPITLKSIEMLGLGKHLKWYPTLDNAVQMAAAM